MERVNRREKLSLLERMLQTISGKIILTVWVLDDLWENHINGVGPALGIIPITEANTCKWGCIDIDEYDFDHKALVTDIRNNNFPLVVCRSKSGGA
ncbi:MAG: hypothetical protein ACW990_16435, partial [Promethearchaeota archaeon]